MNYSEILKLVILACAVSPIALTITKTKVFEPFREAVKKRSTWLGKLFSCPYCLSHWISFGMVAVYRPVVFSCGFLPIDLIVSAFCIVGFAAFLSGGIFILVSLIPE